VEAWTDGGKEETGNASVFKSFMEVLGKVRDPRADCKK
jgi:hypothetical protein